MGHSYFEGQRLASDGMSLHKTNKCTCTQDHVDKGMAYINGGYVEDGQVVPTTDGLAIALDVCRKTPYNWAEMDSNEFRDKIAYILDRVQAIQGMKVVNGGLNGEFNSTVAGKMLANHGFNQSSTIDVTSGGETIKTFSAMYASQPKNDDSES